jgi:uncharacterized protein YjcR
MQRKMIPKEIRDEVVAKAKNGQKVADLAETFGISTKTIYNWLARDSGSDTITILKYNKLQRENAELKRIIGKLTLDMSWGKKE